MSVIREQGHTPDISYVQQASARKTQKGMDGFARIAAVEEVAETLQAELTQRVAWVDKLATRYQDLFPSADKPTTITPRGSFYHYHTTDDEGKPVRLVINPRAFYSASGNAEHHKGIHVSIALYNDLAEEPTTLPEEDGRLTLTVAYTKNITTNTILPGIGLHIHAKGKDNQSAAFRSLAPRIHVTGPDAPDPFQTMDMLRHLLGKATFIGEETNKPVEGFAGRYKVEPTQRTLKTSLK